MPFTFLAMLHKHTFILPILLPFIIRPSFLCVLFNYPNKNCNDYYCFFFYLLLYQIRSSCYHFICSVPFICRPFCMGLDIRYFSKTGRMRHGKNMHFHATTHSYSVAQTKSFFSLLSVLRNVVIVVLCEYVWLGLCV